LASGLHCVCVRAWLGAFGISTGEKKIFEQNCNNLKMAAMGRNI